MKIHLSKIYLDLATSFETFRKVGNPNKEVEDEFVYSISSLRVLYSYLAVEAFINRKLYDIILDVIKFNQSFRVDLIGYDESEFFKFAETYPSLESYTKVLLWKELSERINKLACLYGIKRFCDVHDYEWQLFMKVNKLVRDKIIHPNSEEIKFNQINKTLLDAEFSAIAPAISRAIIIHFYEGRGSRIPSFLVDPFSPSFKVSEVQFGTSEEGSLI